MENLTFKISSPFLFLFLQTFAIRKKPLGFLALGRRRQPMRNGHNSAAEQGRHFRVAGDYGLQCRGCGGKSYSADG
jgi:hypothetical protein